MAKEWVGRRFRGLMTGVSKEQGKMFLFEFEAAENHAMEKQRDEVLRLVVAQT